MDTNSLKNDPRLKDIDNQKFDLLNDILLNASGKSKNELLPYFLTASKKAESQGMTFSNQETDIIFEILTKDMSEAEKSRINYMRKLATMFANKQKGI